MVRLRVAPSWPLSSLRSVSRRSFASSPSATFSEAAAAPPESAASAPGVVGSAPELSRHLLIHTPHPTATWPSHLHATSPLAKLLQEKWQARPDLARLGFNFTDGGHGTVAQAWDPTRTKFDEPPADAAVECVFALPCLPRLIPAGLVSLIGTSWYRRYSAVIYPDFVELPSFSIDDLPAFEKVVAELPAASATLPSTTSGDAAPPHRTHIFVCTHRTRDCRCGDIGEPLYDALLHEIKRRKLGGELKSGTDGVRIARVAHIGGHKWAGNALVYRSDGVGDWSVFPNVVQLAEEDLECSLELIDLLAYRYGLLRAEDAPKLLDYATSPSSLPWFSRWRGRLGLSADQVRAAYASRPAAEAENKLDEPRHALGDSVELVFKTFEGEERRVSGYEGESVMVRFSSSSSPSRHPWGDILRLDCYRLAGSRSPVRAPLDPRHVRRALRMRHLPRPDPTSRICRGRPAPPRNDGRRGRAARVCDRRDGRLAPGLSAARDEGARRVDRKGRTDTASSILNQVDDCTSGTYMKLEP